MTCTDADRKRRNSVYTHLFLSCILYVGLQIMNSQLVIIPEATSISNIVDDLIQKFNQLNETLMQQVNQLNDTLKTMAG